MVILLFTAFKNQFFKLDKDSGEVSVYAGNEKSGKNDGLALQASFDINLLSDGSLIITD